MSSRSGDPDTSTKVTPHSNGGTVERDQRCFATAAPSWSQVPIERIESPTPDIVDCLVQSHGLSHVRFGKYDCSCLAHYPTSARS